MSEVEIWKDIPGYEGIYQASTLGQIKSVDRRRVVNARGDTAFCRGKIRSQFANSLDRLITHLCKDGKMKTFHVHALVALTYLGERPDSAHIHHIDGNHRNNHLTNLCYMNDKQHMAMHKYGWTATVGSKNGKAILTEEKVKQMRDAYATGKYQKVEIARMFGTSKSNVARIINRSIWKNV